VQDDKARTAERAGAWGEVETRGLVEGAAVGNDASKVMAHGYLLVFGVGCIGSKIRLTLNRRRKFL
jgi:hypothetical protein